MAGQSAIWQVQDSAANGTEATATATNTLLFNETPIVSQGGVIPFSDFRLRNALGEVPDTDDNGNDLHDMKLAGCDIIITGVFKDSDSSNAGITKLMTWMKESKEATGYEEGRFGLRLDDFPYFNMVPTATYGCMIQDLKFARDPKRHNRAGFILTLRVGGNITSWMAANGF